MKDVAIGRIVHFVTDSGAHRPAVIVEDWPTVVNYQETGTVNLQVLTDGMNDGPHGNVRWETSIPYSEQPEPRTWHWPERK